MLRIGPVVSEIRLVSGIRGLRYGNTPEGRAGVKEGDITSTEDHSSRSFSSKCIAAWSGAMNNTWHRLRNAWCAVNSQLPSTGTGRQTVPQRDRLSALQPAARAALPTGARPDREQRERRQQDQVSPQPGHHAGDGRRARQVRARVRHLQPARDSCARLHLPDRTRRGRPGGRRVDGLLQQRWVLRPPQAVHLKQILWWW